MKKKTAQQMDTIETEESLKNKRLQELERKLKYKEEKSWKMKKVRLRTFWR